MKLSSLMFSASLLMMSLSVFILFKVNPDQNLWNEAVFTGFFTGVFCMVMSVIFDANGH